MGVTAWVLKVAGVTNLPTGDAGALEAVGGAALEQAVARHAVTTARDADAVEALPGAALRVRSADGTRSETTPAKSIRAIAGTALRIVSACIAVVQARSTYVGST